MRGRFISATLIPLLTCLTCVHLLSGPVFARNLGWIPMDRKVYENYLKKDVTKKDVTKKAVTPLPARWDWRDYDAVTVAKDQGQCGSCWAFCITGALESKILILSGREHDLSEQMLISCYGSPQANGCCGGWLDAVRFYQNVSPREEGCYPYGDGKFAFIHDDGCPPTTDMACNYTCPPVCYNLGDFYTLDVGMPAGVKEALKEDGPGVIGFEVYNDFLTYWTSPAGTSPWTDGVYYRDSDEFDCGHGVQVIGWDDATQSYLCKNSWGPTGGPFGDGTFRIRYDQIAEAVNFTIVEGVCDNYNISLQHRKTRVRNTRNHCDGSDATLEMVCQIRTSFPERIPGGYIFFSLSWSDGRSDFQYEPIPNGEYCRWESKKGTLFTRTCIDWGDSRWIDAEYWIEDTTGMESEHEHVMIYRPR